jgi:hypothetical protein
MAEKYARGAFSIIIKFDGKSFRDAVKYRRNLRAIGCDKNLTFYRPVDRTIWIDNMEFGMTGSAQDRSDFDVLVRVVQLAELVQVDAFPAKKGFRSLDGILHPLTGRFYSIAGGFEVDPIIACRELEVAILRAVIQPNDCPHRVVKGPPEIVDSIAYYRGECARQFFEEAYSNGQKSVFGVSLDTKSMWFFGNETAELPFEIGNVILGPLDFLFSAVEHGAR